MQDLHSAEVRHVYVASIVERGTFPGFTCLSIAQFNKIRRNVNKKLAKYFFVEEFVDVGGYLISQTLSTRVFGREA